MGPFERRPTPPLDDMDPPRILRIDPLSPRPERVHDVLAGGVVHFRADERLADLFRRAGPAGVDSPTANVRALGAFMRRAVRDLVDAGVRQFLNVGPPIPTGNGLHQVAQARSPECRVVYATTDALVAAHADVIHESTLEGGTTAVVCRSLRRDPQGLLQEAAATLDFDEPLAVVLLNYLNFIPDDMDPFGVIAQVREALPPGSYLVIAHGGGDLSERVLRMAEEVRRLTGWPYFLHSSAEIAQFFGDFELLEPGLVHIDEWRGDDNRPIRDCKDLVPIYAAVGRKRHSAL